MFYGCREVVGISGSKGGAKLPFEWLNFFESP